MHHDAWQLSQLIRTKWSWLHSSRSKSNCRNLKRGSNRIISRFGLAKDSLVLKTLHPNASIFSHSRARISERFVPSKGTFAPADLYRYFPLRAAKYKIIFENFRISLSTLFEYLRTLSEHTDDITYLRRIFIASGWHTERHTFRLRSGSALSMLWRHSIFVLWRIKIEQHNNADSALLERSLKEQYWSRRKETRVRSQYERLCTESILFQTRRVLWIT